MIVVSVKFKGRGKTYFFDPNGLTVPEGVQVVVETSKGMELAECVQGNHEVTDARIVPPLRPVVRIATADDRRVAAMCKEREKDAFAIAEKKIAEHGLDMKLVDVECNFEGSKILFFFTADGRVDFRELVKDLAGVFRTRIELRQIGVRDEAKMLGGIGICGRPYCCHAFLDDFQPVSTKMAKTQSLSLNPAKISGSCGRLMCCLRYEQEAYEELVKHVPKNGAFVETPDGYGNVAQVNLLRQTVKVRLDGDDNGLHSYDADEVAAIPGGRPKPGEPLPHVLQPRARKPEQDEPKEDEWTMPPIFAEDTARQAEAGSKPEQEKKSSSSRRRSRSRSGQPRGEEAQQLQQQKPKAEPRPHAEKSAEENGEQKKAGGSSRRRHRGGRGHGSGQGQNPAQGQPQQGQKNPSQNGEKPPRPQQHKPKPQAEKPVGEGGEQKKSSGNSHRRHRRPRSKGSGEQPKAEA